MFTDSVGVTSALLEGPVSSAHSEQRREGKITSYQRGLGWIFIELHPCTRPSARSVGISLSPQICGVGKRVVLALIRVAGRTSVLTRWFA